MKIKVIKSTVMDGSVWLVGDVCEIADETAQAAIKRGDAIAFDDGDAPAKADKKK